MLLKVASFLSYLSLIKFYPFVFYSEIILADEPTGKLDPQTSIELLQILKDLNKQGKTIMSFTPDRFYGNLSGVKDKHASSQWMNRKYLKQ